MSNSASLHGIDKNMDLDPAIISRDTRSLKLHYEDFVINNGDFVLMGLGLVAGLLPFTNFLQISDLIFVFGILFWFYARKKTRDYPFRLPAYIDKEGNEKGILFLGNDGTTGEELWFSNSDMRTHAIVFGTTGSGKTRFLLGLLYQALLMGSGAIYIDGKGDNEVWWLAYSLCRRLGREDDLLVMNYLTGGEPVDDPLVRKSNTNNAFAYGSSDNLKSLIVGLMRESGGDGLWKGRASAMMTSILKALVELRDQGHIELNITTIRTYLVFEKLLELSRSPHLSELATNALRGYFDELPGYSEDLAIMNQLPEEVTKQHGFLTMQLTEVMSELSVTYGHIFSPPIGEIDFKDILFNRRILFVMLPALSKDPDSLAGLGKIIVAGVRSALVPALGDKTEGTRQAVLDLKPTKAKVPFVLILDEYGYYSVKGFAVVAAQARSLGMAVIFAGQDYPSFKSGSESEAAATLANTSINITMKIEDSNETFKVVESRAGTGVAAVSSGYDRNTGLATSFREQESTRLETKGRMSLRDLVAQGPGEAHVIYGDKLVRVKLFYADPQMLDEVQVNKFLMVSSPTRAYVDALKGSFDHLNKLFGIQQKGRKPIEALSSFEDKDVNDTTIESLIKDFLFSSSRNQSGIESGIFACGLMQMRNSISDENLLARANGKVKGIPLPDGQITARNDKSSGEVDELGFVDFDDDLPETDKLVDLDDHLDGFDEMDDDYDACESTEDSAPESAEDDLLGNIYDDFDQDSSIRHDVGEVRNSIESLLNQITINYHREKEGGAMSPAQEKKILPRNQLRDAADLSGLTKKESLEDAEKSMTLLNAIIRYPSDPTPKKMTESEVMDSVKAIIDHLNGQDGA